jgi:hypothetical protein
MRSPWLRLAFLPLPKMDAAQPHQYRHRRLHDGPADLRDPRQGIAPGFSPPNEEAPGSAPEIISSASGRRCRPTGQEPARRARCATRALLINLKTGLSCGCVRSGVEVWWPRGSTACAQPNKGRAGRMGKRTDVVITWCYDGFEPENHHERFARQTRHAEHPDQAGGTELDRSGCAVLSSRPRGAPPRKRCSIARC